MESDFERMVLLTQYLVLFTFLGALAALLFAVFQAKKVLKFSRGNDLMKKISDYIVSIVFAAVVVNYSLL